jgi:hypothetical protein
MIRAPLCWCWLAKTDEEKNLATMAGIYLHPLTRAEAVFGLDDHLGVIYCVRGVLDIPLGPG